METSAIKKKFKSMGADVSFGENRRRTYNVDVRKGNFILEAQEGIDISVVDVDAKDRHLLINITEAPLHPGEVGAKHKFLCGHDERDWFVAAVPEVHHWVKSVEDAKQALKPKGVVEVERNLPGKKKNKRKNKARIRQGEWFFVPDSTLTDIKKIDIHKKEPITRGNGGKPHIVDEVYRSGGIKVYVSRSESNGITEENYKKLSERERISKGPWRMMVRDATVYARGCVRHADHATITLNGWHRVFMNSENLAQSRNNMSFLD